MNAFCSKEIYREGLIFFFFMNVLSQKQIEAFIGFIFLMQTVISLSLSFLFFS